MKKQKAKLYVHRQAGQEAQFTGEFPASMKQPLLCSFTDFETANSFVDKYDNTSELVEIKDILKNLCYYDSRNPEGIITNIAKEELKNSGFGPWAKEDCDCNSCSQGRTFTAVYILNILRLNGLYNEEIGE